MLVSGGPLTDPSLARPAPTAPDALLWSSYFGQTARPLAKILLGGVTDTGEPVLPTGRLPFTVPADAFALPHISDYRMQTSPDTGRTYRYMAHDASPPLYPFGHAAPLGMPWRCTQLAPTPPALDVRTLLVEARRAERAAADPNPPAALPPLCDETHGGGISVTVTMSGGDSQTAPAVLLFGSVSPRQTRSPFPRRQLLAWAKPTKLTPGEHETVRLRVCARELVSRLGVGRLPVPGVLRLWVGDASGPEADTAQVDIPIGAAGRAARLPSKRVYQKGPRPDSREGGRTEVA